MSGGCFTDAMLHSSITCHQENASRATQGQARCLQYCNLTYVWFLQSVRGINVTENTRHGSDGNLKTAGGSYQHNCEENTTNYAWKLRRIIPLVQNTHQRQHTTYIQARSPLSYCEIPTGLSELDSSMSSRCAEVAPETLGCNKWVWAETNLYSVVQRWEWK